MHAHSLPIFGHRQTMHLLSRGRSHDSGARLSHRNLVAVASRRVVIGVEGPVTRATAEPAAAPGVVVLQNGP